MHKNVNECTEVDRLCEHDICLFLKTFQRFSKIKITKVHPIYQKKYCQIKTFDIGMHFYF